MGTVEIAIWILMWTLIAVPTLMFAYEMDKLERIQDECLEVQRSINKDWDIRLKHISNLNDELSRIFWEHSRRE